jgi:hypothetical protein
MQSYMLSSTEVAYLAGLFDGEGCAQYKQYWVKKKNKKNPAYCWFIRLELAMTDEKTIKYVHDSLKIGWFGTRKVKPGRKPQWRWSTSYRGANEVAKMFLPYAQTKKTMLQKIVDHYGDKK